MHIVCECPRLQSLKDNFAGLFQTSTTAQFCWQINLEVSISNISKFLCEPLYVKLDADSYDQSQDI